MDKIRNIVTASAVGVATFLAGGEVGHQLTKSYDTKIARIFRTVDTDNNHELSTGEAFQLADKNKDGHISDTEKKDVEETRDALRAYGHALIKSADNIDKALKSVGDE